MNYWSKILEEVLNKNNTLHSPVFTEKRMNAARDKRSRLLNLDLSNKRAKKHTQLKSASKKYPLGPRFQNVYFTRREAQLMIYFLKGKNTTQVAKLLDLSPRTVEFYINNMKIKLCCRLKSELIQKVSESDFLKWIDFEC